MEGERVLGKSGKQQEAIVARQEWRRTSMSEMKLEGTDQIGPSTLREVGQVLSRPMT